MCDLENCDTGNLQTAWPASQYNEWINGAGESNLVSVVIPTYNRADLIEETLDSVWEQSYRPIEVITVDDGSDDDTAEVVKDWMERIPSEEDLEVAYYYQENQGVASARNLGISESRGSYIQLLDSDDQLHPKKIATQIRALEAHPQAEFVYCLTDYFGKEADESRTMGYNISDRGLRGALVENPYQTSAALYRRGLVSRAGPFGRDLSPADDWEFAIRAYIAAEGNVLFQEVAYNHQRADSHERLTAQEKKFCESRLRAMCHNKDVLHEVGLLKRKEISSCLGMNFIRISLLLHDSGSSRESVSKALENANELLGGGKGAACLWLVGLSKSDWAFWVAKSVLRGGKRVEDVIKSVSVY